MSRPVPVIDVETFKQFIRLQDPYENARERARQLAGEPNKKAVYVGYQALEGDPDAPAPCDHNVSEFPPEIQTSYEIVKLQKTRQPKHEDPHPTEAVPTNLRTSTDDRERGLFEKLGHWEDVMHHERLEKAKKSDRKQPLVPKCIEWSVNDVVLWLNSIGMAKYEETFVTNGICGIRLCIMDASRLGKMGVQDWDDIKVILCEIHKETRLKARPQPNSRDVRKSPLDDIDMYLDFKNVLGSRADTTSFRQFRIQHENVIWDVPERSLQYPGMIIHQDHAKPFDSTLRF